MLKTPLHTAAQAVALLQSRAGLPPKPENMRRAAILCGLHTLQIIHIAGTNGKGSTAAMLHAVLRHAGLRTGLFTSPHLHRFNERIRVNGAEIDDAALVGCVQEALAAEGDTPLNYFSLATLAGIAYFARMQCDVVILEAGLGGRLDSTNCAQQPLLTLLTRIGIDHIAQLGDTLAAITAEKAGIIKPGCPLVLAPQQAGVAEQVAAACAEAGAPLYYVDELPYTLLAGRPVLSHPVLGELPIGLAGSYQAENASTVLFALDVLQGRGLQIPHAAIRNGLQHASWPARFELLGPRTVLDGAHNPQGAAALRNSLEEVFPGARCVFVMGAMADKDYAGCIAALAPLARAFVAVPIAGSARAMPEGQLCEAMRAHGEAHAAETAAAGMALGRRLCQEDDVLVLCGSLYLAGQMGGVERILEGI